MVLGWWFSFSSIESATKIQKTFLDKSDGHSNRQIQNSSNQRLPVSDFLPTNIHPCSSLYLYWLRLTLDVIRRKGVWSHIGQESRRECTSHTLISNAWIYYCFTPIGGCYTSFFLHGTFFTPKIRRPGFKLNIVCLPFVERLDLE